MKILTLHCDYIKFQALKKALKSVADLTDAEKKAHEVREALVVFTAVEKGDEAVSEIVAKLCENVSDIAKQVNTNSIVLYPYAHLSSNLSAPAVAQEVLQLAEKELSKKYDVSRAPFGYYKTFELKVKGHPLSELSRELHVELSTKNPETYDHKKLLHELGKTKLDTSKLKENDHRILGQQLDLFSFSDVAPGMVFWHPNGIVVMNELLSFWRELHRNAQYQEIKTPQIMDQKLWQISGHWEKYKENIFLTEYEKRNFAVKPMNCPGAMMVFRSRPRSYKELPLRLAEIGVVHRQELSGVLGGLFRLIQFTQDDAHLFCTEDTLEAEIKAIMQLIDVVYKKFGLTYHVELSTRPEKRIGDEKLWDKAEKTLESVLKKQKANFKINPGDGAFYGPKIDFHVKDSLGRTWQCATVQLDFMMPERFELEYTTTENTKKRPIMLHRVIFGAIERFLGVLLEHTNGRLPTWLSPMQVRVISFTDRNVDYSKKIVEKLGAEIPGIRIDADFRQSTVQSKVKEAELQKIPYIIVVGDKEEKENTLAVRVKGSGKIETFKPDTLIARLSTELVERS